MNDQMRLGLALVCAAWVLPFACSDDDSQATGPTSAPAASNAASSTASSSSSSSSSASSTTGAGGAGGDTGAGGATPQTCENCLGPLFGPQGMCDAPHQACAADTECTAWIGCYDGCIQGDFTAPCFATCDQTHMAAMSLYQPVVTCMCGTCSAECAPFCM